MTGAAGARAPDRVPGRPNQPVAKGEGIIRAMNALNVAEYIQTLGLQARQASTRMSAASTSTKNKALRALARMLRDSGDALAADNRQDLERAQAAGLAAPMVDRLKLTPKIVETLAVGCEQLAAMPDIVGEISGLTQQPSGIRVGRCACRSGVFGMVYESRPNVTIEAASLSIKSGNACILRGGSEAIAVQPGAGRGWCSEALAAAGLPGDAVQLVQTTDREAVGQLIAMPQYVDVIIPRGGKGLIERISARRQGAGHQAPGRQLPHLRRRPVRPGHGGALVDNAKTQKYSPCNASEGAAGGARRWRRSSCRGSAPCSRPRAWRCAATRGQGDRWRRAGAERC